MLMTHTSHSVKIHFFTWLPFLNEHLESTCEFQDEGLFGEMIAIEIDSREFLLKW